MNFSSTIGFILAASVFTLAVLHSFSDIAVIINVEAILIVIGGTLAATVICFPLQTVIRLLGVFVKRVFRLQQIDFAGAIQQISKLSVAFRRSSTAYRDALMQIQDPMLRDAGEILLWLKAEVSAEDLRKTLVTRANTHFSEYMNDAKIFKTIAKFPPAFGLMGTTIGMIALLQSLKNIEAAKSAIGPAMAVSLVATLYGLLLANFVFTPISENLLKSTQEDTRYRHMIIEGIMLIQQEKPTKYVEEHLKSFLLPRQRKIVNEVMKNQGGPEREAA